MDIAFKEAKKLYGEPKYPVNKTCIFLTERRDIAEYAISDIRNWEKLLIKLNTHQLVPIAKMNLKS